MLELKPKFSRRKSFYKKAHITFTSDNEIVLISYTTKVAKYNANTKQFTKLWNGYSRTTMEHIAEFCAQFEIPFTPNKKNWLSLPFNNDKTRYYVEGTNGFVTHKCKETLFDNYYDAEIYADNLNNDFWHFWVVEYDN